MEVVSKPVIRKLPSRRGLRGRVRFNESQVAAQRLRTVSGSSLALIGIDATKEGRGAAGASSLWKLNAVLVLGSGIGGRYR
jgi:hypothetical protein